MSVNRNNLLAYSLTHALIDCSCAVLVFTIHYRNLVSLEQFVFLTLLYNLLAFATQPLIGLVVDLSKKAVAASVCGICLVAISLLIISFPVGAVVLAGIGNAVFHTGAGAICLRLYPPKATAPGIFVAPGALGLAAGIYMGKHGMLFTIPLIILCIIAITAILSIKSPEFKVQANQKKKTSALGVIVLLMFISIIIRGLVGLSVQFPWKSDFILLVMLTLAIVAGKMVGGILSDKFGEMRVAMTGLAGSALLLYFFSNQPVVAIIGIFLFNLTMPITLNIIGNIFPNQSGFAFGLTALALFFGALPTFSNAKFLFMNTHVILGLILISAILSYIGIKLYYTHKIELLKHTTENENNVE